MNKLFSLEGRVALVTGAARGLGRPMAYALGCAGAHIILNDIDAEVLADKVAAMKRVGLQVTGLPFDVGDADARAAAISSIVREHGRLDALFNNAGIGNMAPTVELELENWREVINIDLTAPFHLAREAAKPMMAQGSGRIVNTASVAGVHGAAGLAHYVSAKAGLIGLTKAFAVEFGPHGINCNAIAPGYFTTSVPFPTTTPASEKAEAERRARAAERIPLRRFAEPDELGGVAVFLASTASSYVNGHVIPVDGGLTIAL